MEWFDAFIVVFASGMRLAVPLILACLAGLWSERSGIVDIGLEGKILVGAFASAVGGDLHRQRMARARARRRRGHRLLAHPRLRLDRPARQPDRLRHRDQHGGRRAHRADRQRHLVAGRPDAATAGRGAVRRDRLAVRRTRSAPCPIIGPIYEHLISGHDIITYVAFLLVPLTYWALYSTRFGLRLRAVGENPAAVDTAGISVRALRYSAVVICGVLVGPRRRLSRARRRRAISSRT